MKEKSWNRVNPILWILLPSTPTKLMGEGNKGWDMFIRQPSLSRGVAAHFKKGREIETMNKKTLRIAGWALCLSMAVAGIGAAVGAAFSASGAQPMMVRADETVFYTLTPAAGSNNSYAGNCDVTVGGISWNISGNAQTTPWRIGGKSITKTDRTVYSKTPILADVTKVELTVGAASSITVNSLKMTVASNAAFSSITDVVTETFNANSTITFDKPSGHDWSNSYYKFTFNVTVSGSSNKFVEFSEAKFYSEVTAATEYSVTYDANGGTGTAPTDSNEYDAENNTVTVLGNTGGLTKDGYNWAGWALNEAGTGTVYGPAYTTQYTISEDTTFYAKWNPKVLNSIRGVTVAPTTTKYEAGEYFDPTGLVIYATIDDVEVQTNIASSMVWNGGDPLSLNQTSVTGVYTLGNVEKVITISGLTVTAPESVTFVAGTDKGSTTGNNSADAMSKSGIAISSTDGAFATTEYRFYANSSLTFDSTIGNMAKIEFIGDNDKKMGDISISAGGGSVTSSGNDATWTGDASSVTFSFSAQNRATSIVITMVSTDPLVELNPDSASSVSMLKGSSDTSVKVLVKNIDDPDWSFTFDEDEKKGLETSDYISVAPSEIADNVATLTITTKKVGSTSLHISVSGTDCETAIPVTVSPRPASIVASAKAGTPWVDGKLEVKTGGSGSSGYKMVDITAKDTDNEDYEDALVWSSSNTSIANVTDTGRIYGVAAGETTITVAAEALPSVYATIAVKVMADTNASVNSITFNNNLADTQGESLDISEIFDTRVANTYFGSTANIADDELRFSYDDSDYENAVAAASFTYDFTHGEDVDATHKLQTVYVYTTFTESRVASFEITIEQANNPLQGITLDTGDELDLLRNTTHQLVVTYNPANTTDSKEVEYSIDEENSDVGSSISVSSTGLISAGNAVGKSAIVVVTSKANPSLSAEVIVNTTLENMTITADVPEVLTPSTTVAVGDTVAVVAVDKESTKYELTAFSGASTDYGVATAYDSSVSKGMLLTVEAGSESGSVSFKTAEGKYLAWVSNKNSITPKGTKDAYGSWVVNGSAIQNVQDSGRYLYLNYNNGTPRFASYTDKSSDPNAANYTVPTFVKVTGGTQSVNVDSTLFNLVYGNMGTYVDEHGVEQLGIDICDYAGSTLDKDAWDAIKSGFTASIISTYKLNYARANASGNEVEKFLSAYDYVVRKYGEDYDFLGRIASGKISHASRESILGSATQNGNSSWVIASVLVSGLIAATGFAFLRRKKEDR